jgi:hypothetical protein
MLNRSFGGSLTELMPLLLLGDQRAPLWARMPTHPSGETTLRGGGGVPDPLLVSPLPFVPDLVQRLRRTQHP